MAINIPVSDRLRAIRCLGVRLANERTDIDPSAYDFALRGFVGPGNDAWPRMQDLTVLGREFGGSSRECSWEETKAFCEAHRKVMSARIAEAMNAAHGVGWCERAHAAA